MKYREMLTWNSIWPRSNTEMWKMNTEILDEPISQIVNMSLDSKFPGCKATKVRPIFKKEKNTKPKNYRPVSLLFLMSNIIERSVNN